MHVLSCHLHDSSAVCFANRKLAERKVTHQKHAAKVACKLVCCWKWDADIWGGLLRLPCLTLFCPILLCLTVQGIAECPNEGRAGGGRGHQGCTQTCLPGTPLLHLHRSAPRGEKFL